MGDKSAIEWTDATWNPVTGCSKVSPGCAHCYAERVTQRFGSKLPWTPANAASNVVLHPERLDQPLRWRKPRRVFVNSMSDLFHEQVPEDFLIDIFSVMAVTPEHTYQILTKRPEQMLSLMKDEAVMEMVENECHRWQRYADMGHEWPGWPLPNVWLGVSVENQRWADERIPLLQETPAAVRFLSIEPLLGPVDIAPALRLTTMPIHWIICGGESGGPERRRLVEPCREYATCDPPAVVERQQRQNSDSAGLVCGKCMSWNRWRAKPWALAAVRSLRDQCQAAGVPYFFKQWGGPTPKSGGALLDGREWREWPKPVVE